MHFNRSVGFVLDAPQAFLFQDQYTLDISLPPLSTLRQATPKDRTIPFVQEHEPLSLPGHSKRPQYWILSQQALIIGTGKISANPYQPRYADIGCTIAAPYRNQGFGSAFIAQLKMLCYQQQLIPHCGCDISNIASRKMLEKAGFQPTDRMLEVSF